MIIWAHSRAPRILIVDDNPSIHRDFELVLLDNLQNSDLEAQERLIYGAGAPALVPKPAYILDHALSGLEGIEKVNKAVAEKNPYQLAFVDIRMPGIDGVETVERIWQTDAAIQIVICTAFADYSWEALAQRLGPTDKLLVLKKPFDNIEVTQLASTLTEKWFLAEKAALKWEQMEWLVAQRTQQLFALQPSSPSRISDGETHEMPTGPAPSPGATTQPDSSASRPGPEADRNGANPDSPLVLLIESDVDLRSLITRGLGADFRLAEAADGQEGLRLAREAVPDLVISETIVPQLEGIGLCRRLKNDQLTSHIPVIILADAGLEDAQIRALEAGADDYITKPISLELLKARVENLLSSRRRLQTHFRQQSAARRTLAANQGDAQFLRRTIDAVERRLPDYEFDVDALAHELAVSRRQLFRKLRAVTGCTPNAFIRTLRLNRAAQLLRESRMTVTEITYAVGFADLKHFRSVFREQFGVLPAEFARQAER